LLSELLDHFGVDHSGFLAFVDPGLGSLGFGFFLGFSVLSAFSIEVDAVVGVVPLSEGSRVNLHDCILHKGFSSHQLIVRSVVNHIQYSGFAGEGF
jgi:hypothetical protein